MCTTRLKYTSSPLVVVVHAYYRLEITKQECAENCLKVVVRLNMNRLFKRIGSHHFEKPKHLTLYAKGPISPQWNKLMSKPVQRKSDAANLAREAEEFEKAFEQLEKSDTEDEKVIALIDLVKRSFAFTVDGRSLRGRLEAAGYGKKTSATRPFREINKTAAYWRICCNLAQFSRSHRKFFQNLTLVPVEHYKPSTRPGREEERFIHAEVQIITFYESRNPLLWPRALGTSKKACFLCYEFIRCHGCFNVAKSHGIVFSRWAVPDRNDYSPETVARLQRTLAGVGKRVQEELEKAGLGRIKQDDPVQSSIDLNYFSLPNGSAISLQSAGSTTSTFSPKMTESPPRGSTEYEQPVPKNAIYSSSLDSTPNRTSVSILASISGRLKRLLKRLKISPIQEGRKLEAKQTKAEISTSEGKQRIP
jgi:hypothetical protein